MMGRRCDLWGHRRAVGAHSLGQHRRSQRFDPPAQLALLLFRAQELLAPTLQLLLHPAFEPGISRELAPPCCAPPALPYFDSSGAVQLFLCPLKVSALICHLTIVAVS